MAALEHQDAFFFSDLLKAFRQQKKLTQQQLAEKIEVTRETVSLWERGEYKPETDRILYQLADVLGLNEREQARLFEAYTVTALKTSFHHPPFKRNPYFTGRSAQLGTLHRLLSAGKQVALTQAISGLGGIGKTQLALEYAYRYQKSYHDIFWASADTKEALMASYVRFAEVLHLPEVKEADQTKVKEAVCHWFQQHTNWLLVLDNIEDLRLLPSFVPEHRQGAVLLTTRRQVTEPAAQALELEVLPEEEAILFLFKRTKALALDASLGEAPDGAIGAARTITRLLGNLPLALDQAGAYLLETKCSFAEYAALFQMHREHLLQRRIGENIPTDHPDSVTTTFELNFQQIQQKSPAALELLRFCTYLAPDAIPLELITQRTVHLGTLLDSLGADTLQLDQALELLQAYSLVRRNGKNRTLSMHRLELAVLQGNLDEAQRRLWAERALRAVHAISPEVEHSEWQQRSLHYERLLPQIVAVSELIEQYQFLNKEAGHLLSRTAFYLRERARYGEAESLYLRALHIQEQMLGPDQLDTATSLNGLASLYWRQGKYAQAEPLFLRALHIREQQLGPDHPHLAYSLNGLANLYAEQGKYAQAEPLFQRALRIRERQLGSEHPEIAETLHDLATFREQQGNRQEALALYERALAIRKQALGRTHPKTHVTRERLTVLRVRIGQEGGAPLQGKAPQEQGGQSP